LLAFLQINLAKELVVGFQKEKMLVSLRGEIEKFTNYSFILETEFLKKWIM